MEEEKCKHVYMQCMKNQSSNLGTYTIDGCGEFIPHDDGGPYCAACACHRSFHLKVPAARYISSQVASPLVPTDQDHVLDKKRRARTKFTAEQKEKMGRFAEKIGWRMGKRKREEEEIERFLDEAGVSRRAFKVWMHNHRYNAASQSHQVDANSSGTETTNNNVEMEVKENDNAYTY